MRYSNYSPHTRKRGLGSFIAFGFMMFFVGAIVGGLVGVFGFIRITGGTGEASAPVSAPTLSLDSETPSAEVVTLTTEITATAEDNASPIVPSPTVAQTQVIPSEVPSLRRLFRIVSAESEAQFAVYETFPEGTAIGRTNQIAGDIVVDFDIPANSQIGTIRIYLRTLRTDDPDRDRSIRCCILLTAQDVYEFSDFVPTSIIGMPQQIQIGQTVGFQVTGNLTLRATTRPVTFDVSVTLNSLSEIRGTASARVNRSDFGILNDEQNGFNYHGVAEQVTLTFDLVAREVET